MISCIFNLKGFLVTSTSYYLQPVWAGGADEAEAFTHHRTMSISSNRWLGSFTRFFLAARNMHFTRY